MTPSMIRTSIELVRMRGEVGVEELIRPNAAMTSQTQDAQEHEPVGLLK